MKKSNILMFSVLVLVIALIAGGTMAWFTADAEVLNTFTAGEIEIAVTEEFDEDAAGNVNPGDTIEKEVNIENVGTKRAYIRVLLEPRWTFTDDEVLEDWGPASVDDLHDDWFEGADGNYYYENVLGLGETAPPPFANIVFDGAEMDNEYQGARFELNVIAEAIQVTNGAVESQWPDSGLVSID